MHKWETLLPFVGKRTKTRNNNPSVFYFSILWCCSSRDWGPLVYLVEFDNTQNIKLEDLIVNNYDDFLGDF
jgi:hypothetical protein